MSTIHSCSAMMCLTLLAASGLSAQTLPGRESTEPVAVTLISESDRVRFTTPGLALEWRLEVANAQRDPVFDSGVITGQELDWPLVDEKGQTIESGVYTYTLTIRSRGSEPRIQRGQLQIERARSVYQIAALNTDAASGVVLTVTEGHAGPPTQPATPVSEPFRRSLGAVTFVQPLISGSGTTFSMTRWIDGPSGVVGDANVTEQNGSVIVGNGSFKGNLQIFGGATDDVFAGMGPNLITGPGFNYGYAGSSFGRSTGFFNVRPDASASAPNPSLRFMTVNVQRMIITNTGDVGIGITTPAARLQVVDSTGKSGRVQVGSTVFWNAPERRIISFGDAGCSGECVYVGEEDGDDRLVLSGNAQIEFKTFGSVLPELDNYTNLGGPSNRWATVYAANGTINTSDARLKQDIRILDNGLASVLKLRPVSFAWKNGTDRRRHLGLLAQEVEPVIPEAVYRDANPDAPLGMNYADLIPVVIKAIQEQQATLNQQGAAIASLQTENAALRQRNHELDARLTALERTLRLVLSK